MPESTWHLGLRAWNVGKPPHIEASSPLSADEEELTEWLISIHDEPLEMPLAGPTGSLRPALEHRLQWAWERHAGLADQALIALEDSLLAQIEESIRAELDHWWAGIAYGGDQPRSPGLKDALKGGALPLAASVIAVNTLQPATPLRGVVVTSWLVGLTAHWGIRITVRERHAYLAAFEREVARASADEGDDDSSLYRLAAHLFSGMLRPVRRSVTST